MAKLALSGINLGAMMAKAFDPKITLRDVGDVATAVDGSTRVTRSARKYDTVFKSVPLSVSDAAAWRSLITGEGETWTFDSSLYGSKGLGPSSSTNASQSSGSAKFGAGKLSVGATTGTITWNAATANPFGRVSDWTISLWRSTDGGATYLHNLIRSDGSTWLNGVASGIVYSPWLTISGGGNVTIFNTTGTAILYDDLVILPFKVLDDWPAQIYAYGSSFGALPLLPATGDLVTEQSSRSVYGSCETSNVMRTGDGMRITLDVELRAA